MKSLSLQELCPEIGLGQWKYLAYFLNEQLELSFVQRDKLECLLGVTIQL